MSLGGIAIAIGAMIDAAIVMIENMHKHLERAATRYGGERWRGVSSRRGTSQRAAAADRRREREGGGAGAFRFAAHHHGVLPPRLHAPGAGGRMFKPLAFTKTFAMAAASLLSVTLVPVTMGLFIRGRIHRERATRSIAA